MKTLEQLIERVAWLEARLETNRIAIIQFNELLKQSGIKKRDAVESIDECPFCGEEDVMIDTILEGSVTEYQVSCSNCNATGSSKPTKKEAAEIWSYVSRRRL